MIFCCTRWHIPKSSSLLVLDSVPARLCRAKEGGRREGRSYSAATLSVLVTFHLVNTVCLWSLSIWPEVLPEWQRSVQGTGVRVGMVMVWNIDVCCIC